MTHNLPAWMVEASYRYLCAAKWLLRGNDLMDVAQINASLGVEILLKSFISSPDSNHGKANQTYEVDFQRIKSTHKSLMQSGKFGPKEGPAGHNLLTLYHAVPEDIRSIVGISRHAESLERYRNVFTGSRYAYESGTPDFYDTTLIEILDDLVPRVVEYHRSLGSQDTFIRCHGMTPLRVEDFIEPLS